MRNNLKLDDAELRRQVEKVLAGNSSTQVSNVASIIAQDNQSGQSVAGGFGAYQITFSGPELSFTDRARIYDIIWDLIIEGHVRPGLGDGQNNDLPYIHVTKTGKGYFQESVRRS